jgi:hypothetical protein
VSEMDIHEETADDTEVEEAETDLQTDLEAPEADVVEQHQLVGPDGPRPDLDHLPPDADEADVTEQRQVVALDEDDYR